MTKPHIQACRRCGLRRMIHSSRPDYLCWSCQHLRPATVDTQRKGVALDPPCTLQPLLFESTDRGDHEIAREMCEACPVLDWCAGELHKARMSAELPDPRFGPMGTWAGQLVGVKKGRMDAVCGTASGYARHRRLLAEDPCADCKAAHALEEKTRKAAHRREQNRADQQRRRDRLKAGAA